MNSSKMAGVSAVSPRTWFALFVISLAYAINYFDRSILGIAIQPLKRDFALTDSQLGFLTGFAFSLPYVISSIPLGLLADRVNRRNLLGAVLFVWSALTATCGLAQSFPILAISRCAVGAAEAGAGPASMSLIGDYFPPHRRAFALNMFWMSVPVGMSLCLILGGYVSANYGWRDAFFVAGALGLAVLILFVTVKEPSRGAMDSIEIQPRQLSTLSAAWASVRRQPAVLNVLIGMILMSIVNSGVAIWLPVFLVRVKGLPLAQAGLYAGLAAGICGLIGTPLVGIIGDATTKRFGLPRLPLVSAANGICVVSGAALLALGGPTASWIGMGLFYTFFISYAGPSYGFVVTKTSPHIRAVTLAALQTGTNLVGWGVGPFIVGMVSDRVGGTASLRTGMLVILLFGVWSIAHLVTASILATRSRDLELRAAQALP
jgi:sugar phosphate permease